MTPPSPVGVTSNFGVLLCSAAVGVGFYGNSETNDGVYQLLYSLDNANHTFSGVDVLVRLVGSWASIRPQLVGLQGGLTSLWGYSWSCQEQTGNACSGARRGGRDGSEGQRRKAV